MKTSAKRSIDRPTRPLPSRAQEQKVFKSLKSPQARMDLKAHKTRTVIAKADRGIGSEAALCRASALGPTRVVLPINYDNLFNFVTYLAKMVSMEIQSRGNLPELRDLNPKAEWNPSLVLGYLWAIYGTRLALVGALPSSNSLLVMGNYTVPSFIAKHLQQISPSTHMGREVAVSCNKTLDQFLAQDCGYGGLYSLGATVSTPCWYKVAGDTEGYFTAAGTGTTTLVTPVSMTTEDFSTLSAVISRVFVNVCKVRDIPLRASNNELKVTPVAEGANGQFIYSCLDDSTMCDLTLPLASFNEAALINSPNPLQAAAPVRIDSSLAQCAEAKVAFLFWLGNKYKFDKADSFLSYLRRFGLKDKHLGNAQINLRQINWQSFVNLVGTYLATLTALDSDGYWILFNYLVAIMVSNIPAPFRSFCPLNFGWGVSRQFETIPPFAPYASFVKTPKMPPFMTNFIHSLRTPIRSGGQISYFFLQLSPGNTATPYWANVAANSTGAFSAGVYGTGPLSLELNNLAWNDGPYNPYPGFQVAPPTYVGSVRNMIPLKGTASATAYLQSKLIGSGNQNLFTQWSDKGVKFMKRSARFYIPAEEADYVINFPPALTNGFRYVPIVPRLISSWEPVGYTTAVLALATQLTYYLPFKSVPLLPTFSSIPATGVENASASVIASANPGQGSQQAIAIGKSANPAEVQAHISAEGVTGVVSDQSVPIPEHLEKGAGKEIHNLVHTGFEEIKEYGTQVAKDAGTKLAKSLGKSLALLI